MQRGGQTQRAVETLQPRNALHGNGFVRAEILRHVKHTDGKLTQLSNAAFGKNVLHPRGENDGQSRAVGDVVQGAQFMLQLVAGPIRDAARAQQTIVRSAAAHMISARAS